MYCLVLYAYFREEGGIFPQQSFEFVSDHMDATFIAECKRSVGAQWSGPSCPSILVHGVFKI